MRTLVADDDTLSAAILGAHLTRLGIDATVVHDGDAAWRILESENPPQLAILDWMMPGPDGIELCRRVRNTPRLASTYIILLTGRDSRQDLVTGLDAGADDYMTKPVDREELRARIGVGYRVAMLQENLTQKIEELQSARDHLARMASVDALTGVYSRAWWLDLSSKELSRAQRYSRPSSILIADLDWFKAVNDTYGHHVGDDILRQFGTMLLRQCRQSDIVGRFGGEEFVIMLPETPLEAAQTLAARIANACRGLVVYSNGQEVRCSCSMGLADARSDDQLDTVLRRADAALYDAKRAGRDRWAVAA